MSFAIIMIYINDTNFVLIKKNKKDHSIVETCRLNNAIVFFETE